MREDLENVYMLLFWFVGNGFQLAPLQRELACDPGVRRSRARSHRLRAVVRAAERRRWRAKRDALHGSHNAVVPNCVNVWFSFLLDVKIMIPLTTRPDRVWW